MELQKLRKGRRASAAAKSGENILYASQWQTDFPREKRLPYRHAKMRGHQKKCGGKKRKRDAPAACNIVRRHAYVVPLCFVEGRGGKLEQTQEKKRASRGEEGLIARGIGACREKEG